MMWAALPMVLGWSTHALISGSMSPQVRVGDVVVSAPVDTDTLEVGNVIVFEDPAHEGRVVSHRIKEITEDGSFVTKGDANTSTDLMPVPAENVLGAARLRVPWIGWPAVWFGNHQFGPLLATLLGLVTALSLALRPQRRTDETPAPDVALTHRAGTEQPGASGCERPAPARRSRRPARCLQRPHGSGRVDQPGQASSPGHPTRPGLRGPDQRTDGRTNRREEGGEAGCTATPSAGDSRSLFSAQGSSAPVS